MKKNQRLATSARSTQTFLLFRLVTTEQQLFYVVFLQPDVVQFSRAAAVFSTWPPGGTGAARMVQERLWFAALDR